MKKRFEKIFLGKKLYLKVYHYKNQNEKNRNNEISLSLKMVKDSAGRNSEIVKNIDGKPVLQFSKKRFKSISISHNSNMIAVLFSNKQKCGFDIENIAARIEKLKHKFCSDYELNKWTDLKNLTLIWTFKEAIYKYYSEEKLNFKNEILILEIDSRGVAKAIVELKNKKQRKIILGFKLIGENIISYVKNEYPSKNIHQ